jgi:hypothetical protein
LPLAKQGVGKIDSGRAHADHHGAGFGLGLGNVAYVENFGTAKLIEDDCFHDANLAVGG